VTTSELPEAGSPPVDTGRLFRSIGAQGPSASGAIPAIDAPATGLRSLAESVGTTVTPLGTTVTPLGTSPVPDDGIRGDETGAQRARGLSSPAVWLLVVGVTLAAGIVDAFIGASMLGWLTGMALLIVSMTAAIAVRLDERWTAVVAPPLAFLAATLIAGQRGLVGTGNLLVREGFMIFANLSANAPWIVGSFLIALVIVLLRGLSRRGGER
jgi:hypothetical protein